MGTQCREYSNPRPDRALGLLLAAALSGPWCVADAGSFAIGAADGSFEAGFTGMASEGSAQLISSFGAYRATQASQAALLSTEPDAGATQADADFGALRIDNATIPADAQHLRLDYNLFTDEPTPSFADDRFSVTLALIGAGGLETLLEVDTFGSFYPGQGTAFAEQTGFLTLIADVSAHAGSGAPVTLELRLTDVGDGRGNTAVLLDRLEFTTAGEPIACSGFEYLEVGRDQSTPFDGTCSMDTDGTIADYSWSFDDGTVATGEVVQHAFADEGIYQGTLTVTDDSGNASVDTFIVVVVGDAPVADAGGPYSAGEDDAKAGEWFVTFDGSGSSDDTGIVEYAWDFDASDGIQVDATGVAPTYTYKATGTYTATLTVTDAGYRTDMATAVVTITAGASPVADPGGPYNVGEDAASAGLWTVQLDASGSTDDSGIARYEWDFGDGTTVTRYGSADGIDGFSAGTHLYGYDVADAVSSPGILSPATSWLKVIATEDNTSVKLIDLTSGRVLNSTRLQRFEVWDAVPGDGRYFKVESDKPVLAYESDFDLTGHSTFIPALQGGGVGQEFVFFLHATGAFYVFAYEDATVTFYDKAGFARTQRTLSAGSYWDVVATNDTVYRVASTGRIAMQAVGGDGYTMVPSSTGRGVGRLFYTGTGPLLTGALVAFAHEDTTVSVYDMDTGARLWQQMVAKGAHWYQNGVGRRRLRIESTGDVEVWAGDTQGGVDLVDLGDDISFAAGRDGREFYLHTLSDGAVIFAPFENTVVDVDGNIRTLNTDEYWHLPGGAFKHITASNPVVIQTIGKAGGFNDEGTYLGGRFTAPHAYAAPGTYIATLTAYDNAGQSNTATTTVTVGAGDPPLADAGPAIITEVGFPVNLDATGSSDDHGILSYQWDFGVPSWSFSPGVNVAENEAVITGNRNWGERYFVNDQVFTRNAGDSYTGRIRVDSSGDRRAVMWGLKDTGSIYGLTEFYYAIFFDNGFVGIFESGSSQGGFGTFDTDKNYDVRIDVKANGAAYFIRETGAPSWTQLYDSSHSSAPTFRLGVTIGDGMAHLSEFVAPSGALALPPAMRTDLASNDAVYSVPGTFSPSVTVTDQALQTATDSTTVTVVVGDAPVANAGGAYNTQEDIPTRFDASASRDDYGIKTYVWDFGDGESLTTHNPWIDHRYLAAGTYTASLTVTDYAGQSTNTSTIVTVSAGPAVACVPWAFSGGLEVPHDTWSGREVTLKGVTWSLREPLTYEWDFGDGSPPVSGTVTDKRAIEAKHTYTGPEGAPFVATLTVTDSEGRSATDSYLVRIRAKSLDVEINAAIDEGLWRLHKDQTLGEFVAGTYGNVRIGHGHWDNENGLGGPAYVISPTASALLAFQINGHLETGNVRENPYVETVGRGLRYLPHGLRTVEITPQPAGDPDANANGLGVEVRLSLDFRHPYELGPAIDAFVASGSPETSAITGQGGIIHRRYSDLVQDMVDVHAFGQNEGDFRRGGWGYEWNFGADNSVSGWAAIGLIAAEEVWDAMLPDFVKSENDGWLSRSYNGTGFGYSGPGNGTNTTPAGMIQLAMNGAIGFDDPATGDDERDARWATAEDFIANSWNTEFWFPNISVGFGFADDRFSYYAYFNFLKAMRLAKPQPIVTLHATGLDWFKDETNGIARRLVDRQSADGAWPKDMNPGEFVGNDLVNAWSVTMLTPTLFVQSLVADAGRNRVWGVDVPITFDGSGSFHNDPFRDVVLYEWDLDGDGVFDTSGPDPTLTHTYSSVDFPQSTLPQDIRVQLRVTDNNVPASNDTDTVVITLAVPPHPPVADIGGGYTAQDGVPITLDGSASFDIDPTDFITAWEWDLDNDGTFGDVTGPTPSATFNGVGTYNIGLRVTDNAVLNDLNNNGIQDPEERLEDYAFTTVTVVSNEGPTASANGPYSVDEGSTIALDGGGSTDPTGDALIFFWDFDNDSAYDDATGPNPEYLGVDDGTYPIGLRVTDGGLEAFASSTVTVNNVPPLVDAGPDQAGVAPGGVVSLGPATFTDAGVLDTHTATINWGDGTVEPGVVSETGGSGTVAGSHSYTAAGAYTVTVTVTDDDGAAISASFNVTVEQPADTTAPDLSLPADITAEATGPGGAVVSYTATATDLADGTVPVSCTPASGATFVVGSTVVNCSATDAAGNSTSGSFNVAVVDSMAPALSLPADITAEATGPGGAVVSFAATATDLVDGSVAVSCTPASGATFALGSTAVNCSATDAAGNSGSGSFNVTIEPPADTTGPQLSLSSDITVEATGPGGAVVSYTATATDLVDGTVPVSCTPASGATFALGSTAVSCSATDAAGNSTSGSFDITVVDSTAPELSLPVDITAEATGPGGAVVSFTATATDLVDGSVAVSCTPASGATFAVGSTAVSCSATDTAGNSTSGSFNVTVVDSAAPVLSLPADITAEATGPGGAVVSFTATATDLIDGSVAVSCTPASGATFAVGSTAVSCTATDTAGNTASGSFNVTVVDSTAPGLSLPADITAEATGPGGAVVTYTATATDLVDGTVPVSCTPASGATFALGSTAVSCSATDTAGNSTSGSFNITVADSTAPELSLPADITAEAAGAGGAVVSYTATATDLVDGTVPVSCTPASGATFAVGSTAVSCSATDAAGNTASGSFNVTVADSTAPELSLPADITAEATGPGGAVVSFTATATDLVDGSVAVSCTSASGATFAVDSTAVTCSATDAAGNNASGNFSVMVQDTTAPTITAPPDISAMASAPLTSVALGTPTTFDVVGVVSAISDAPADGFPLGTTLVTWTASDAAGNSASDIQSVTILNARPLAEVQSVSLNEDTPMVITLTGSDPDNHPQPLTYEIVSDPANGNLSGVLPNVIYTPAVDYFGSDSFTFRVFDGLLYSAEVTVSIDVLPVNDPPAVNVDVTTQTHQYSDAISKVTMTASDIDNSSLTVDLKHTVNGGVVIEGLPSALSSTTASCTSTGLHGTTCQWEITGFIGVPEGDYDIQAVVADAEPLTANNTIEVIVISENATVVFDDNNPIAVDVVAPGGDSVTFDLVFRVNETQPDTAVTTAAAGDISLADISVNLVPVGPGGSVAPTGCVTATTGTGYEGLQEVICTFMTVPVNTYSVDVQVGGGYYAGSSEDVLTVFDPSLGFTTGGGWFYWPGTEDLSNGYPGDKTNFGYTMKYNKKATKVQGSLLLIRHTGDGNKYRIKSNAISGLALGEDSSIPMGWASFSGKNTYLEPGMIEAVGNHEFTAYVEDHNEPGIGIDRIWLESRDKDGVVNPGLSIAEPAVDEALELGGGNIVVPHTQGGGN